MVVHILVTIGLLGDDMISLEYKDYYNFGQAGSDNLSILNKLIRVNEYFKITKDDTVLIMLTSWDRIDYYDDLWMEWYWWYYW